jgi:streptomycin 6-kinase
VLRCLHDALLYAADDDALIYAEAAHVAANLINNTAEELDSVHTGPLIEA